MKSHIKMVSMRHINFTTVFKPILGKKTVLLVSGGLDSMVMLDAYRRFLHSPNHSGEVLHFNHHLRGDESDRDERVVTRYCRKHHLKCLVVHLSIPVKRGIQNYARNLRRENLLKLAVKYGWQMALTAHHADDQLETILMKMERGSGLGGLKGMRPFSSLAENLSLYRPLLRFSREQLAGYAKKYDVFYEEDSSNAKKIYTRNRFRHEIIPSLKKDSPDILQEFLKQSRDLEKNERGSLKKAHSFLKKYDQWVPINIYKTLSDEVRFRILKARIKKGFKEEFTRKHFNEIESLIARGLPVQREYGRVYFVIHNQMFHFFEKQADINFVGFTINKPGVYPVPGIGCLTINRKVGCRKKNKGVLYLRAEAVEWPVSVRLPKPGDRFQPFGMLQGKKLVSDFFIDRKIPRIQRKAVPLLDKEGQILCVLGLEIDESMRVKNFRHDCYEVIWEQKSLIY